MRREAATRPRSMNAPRILAADRQPASDPIHRGSMSANSIHRRGRRSGAALVLALGFFVAACATSGAGNDAFPTSGATGKTPGGSKTDGSSGGQPGSQTDDSGSSSSDDGSVTGDDGTIGDDASAGDDGDDRDAAAGCAATCASGCCDSNGNCQAGTDDGMCGAGGATCSDCTTGGGKCQSGSCASTYACTTTLPSPAPVCDSKHQYCLCTSNTQCNSNGLNVVNNGGCHQREMLGHGLHGRPGRRLGGLLNRGAHVQPRGQPGLSREDRVRDRPRRLRRPDPVLLVHQRRGVSGERQVRQRLDAEAVRRAGSVHRIGH